jgi:hypothetical protein
MCISGKYLFQTFLTPPPKASLKAHNAKKLAGGEGNVKKNYFDFFIRKSIKKIPDITICG